MTLSVPPPSACCSYKTTTTTTTTTKRLSDESRNCIFTTASKEGVVFRIRRRLPRMRRGAHDGCTVQWRRCGHFLEGVENGTSRSLMMDNEKGSEGAALHCRSRSERLALGRHALWRHLALPGLAQCKPELVHWACSGQAQAPLDSARGRVYPTPQSRLAPFLLRLRRRK